MYGVIFLYEEGDEPLTSETSPGSRTARSTVRRVELNLDPTGAAPRAGETGPPGAPAPPLDLGTQFTAGVVGETEVAGDPR